MLSNNQMEEIIEAAIQIGVDGDCPQEYGKELGARLGVCLNGGGEDRDVEGTAAHTYWMVYHHAKNATRGFCREADEYFGDEFITEGNYSNRVPQDRLREVPSIAEFISDFYAYVEARREAYAESRCDTPNCDKKATKRVFSNAGRHVQNVYCEFNSLEHGDFCTKCAKNHPDADNEECRTYTWVHLWRKFLPCEGNSHYAAKDARWYYWNGTEAQADAADERSYMWARRDLDLADKVAGIPQSLRDEVAYKDEFKHLQKWTSEGGQYQRGHKTLYPYSSDESIRTFIRRNYSLTI